MNFLHQTEANDTIARLSSEISKVEAAAAAQTSVEVRCLQSAQC